MTTPSSTSASGRTYTSNISTRKKSNPLPLAMGVSLSPKHLREPSELMRKQKQQLCIELGVLNRRLIPSYSAVECTHCGGVSPVHQSESQLGAHAQPSVSHPQDSNKDLTFGSDSPLTPQQKEPLQNPKGDSNPYGWDFSKFVEDLADEGGNSSSISSEDLLRELTHSIGKFSFRDYEAEKAVLEQELRESTYLWDSEIMCHPALHRLEAFKLVLQKFFLAYPSFNIVRCVTVEYERAVEYLKGVLAQRHVGVLLSDQLLQTTSELNKLKRQDIELQQKLITASESLSLAQNSSIYLQDQVQSLQTQLNDLTTLMYFHYYQTFITLPRRSVKVGDRSLACVAAEDSLLRTSSSKKSTGSDTPFAQPAEESPNPSSSVQEEGQESHSDLTENLDRERKVETPPPIPTPANPTSAEDSLSPVTVAATTVTTTMTTMTTTSAEAEVGIDDLPAVTEVTTAVEVEEREVVPTTTTNTKKTKEVEEEATVAKFVSVATQTTAFPVFTQHNPSTASESSRKSITSVKEIMEMYSQEVASLRDQVVALQSVNQEWQESVRQKQAKLVVLTQSLDSAQKEILVQKDLVLALKEQVASILSYADDHITRVAAENGCLLLTIQLKSAKENLDMMLRLLSDYLSQRKKSDSGKVGQEPKKTLTLMGNKEEVPQFLRGTGTVRNRMISREDLDTLMVDVWQEKAVFEEKYGKRKDLATVYYDFLKNKYGVEGITLEWAYSFWDGCQRFGVDDVDYAVFGRLMWGDLPEDFYHSLNKIMDLFQRQLRDFAQSPGAETPKHVNHRAVHTTDLFKMIEAFFPFKLSRRIRCLKFAALLCINKGGGGGGSGGGYGNPPKSARRGSTSDGDSSTSGGGGSGNSSDVVNFSDLFSRGSRFAEELKRQQLMEFDELVEDIRQACLNGTRTKAESEKVTLKHLSEALTAVDPRFPPSVIVSTIITSAKIKASPASTPTELSARDAKRQVVVREFFRHLKHLCYVQRYSKHPEDLGLLAAVAAAASAGSSASTGKGGVATGHQSPPANP